MSKLQYTVDNIVIYGVYREGYRRDYGGTSVGREVPERHFSRIEPLSLTWKWSKIAILRNTLCRWLMAEKACIGRWLGHKRVRWLEQVPNLKHRALYENSPGTSSARGYLRTVTLLVLCLAARLASADTVNAVWNSAADVPVTASGYTATGNTVNFTLNFAPATGTDLVVVNNTALDFIAGTFDNLAQGQAVALSYGGTTYRFVANYYSGSGNDLVLVWANSRAFGWGYNYFGQLGDATTNGAPPYGTTAPVPVIATGVLAGKTAVAGAAGGSHSLTLCSDGTLAAWGANTVGQLGDNTTMQRFAPVAVDIAAGVSALHGKTVVAIAAGWQHSLALCADGTAAAWGDNGYGQLGDNTRTDRLAPAAVLTNLGTSALYGKKVTAIATGAFHSLALCSDGTVAAWGDNRSGQLGDTTTDNRLTPVAVNTAWNLSALYNKNVVAIAAGGLHSLALCSDGTVAAWGANLFGQLGNNSTTWRSQPVAVNRTGGMSALYGKNVVALAAGNSHSVALCSDGTLAAWGYNSNGQLGDTTMDQRLTPVAVNTAEGVSALYGKTPVAIAAGDRCSLALCSDGTAASWGGNGYGELGDGTTTSRNAPALVNISPLATSQRCNCVCSGPAAHHTLALVAAPPASEVTVTATQVLPDRSFQFGFANTPGAFFGVLAATNPALPLSNWTSLTGLTEVSPGQFQFTDPQATNSPHRFYRVSRR